MELTVKDAARLLGVPEKTIRRWVRDRDIPVHHINEQLRFHRAELLEWATSRGIAISSDIFTDGDRAAARLPLLSEALRDGGIVYGLEGDDKPTVLRAIVDMLPLPKDLDREFLFSVLLAREALGSTGIGGGIAIPHVRSPIVLEVDKPTITLCFLDHPIQFDAIDDAPVHTLFTLISPTVRIHHHLLSQLGSVLRNEGFKAALWRRAAPPELMDALVRAEAALAVSGGERPDQNVSPAGGASLK